MIEEEDLDPEKNIKGPTTPTTKPNEYFFQTKLTNLITKKIE
jgi:hypothetical protein